DPFRPTADIDGFLTLPGASTPGHLLGGAGVFLDYTHQSLVAIEPVTSGAPEGNLREIDHRVAARLAGMIGLGRWASVQLDVPFILANRGPSVGSDDPARDVARGGVGDPRISARARVAGARPDTIGVVPVGAGLAF